MSVLHRKHYIPWESKLGSPLKSYYIQEFSLDPSRDSASQFHEAYSWYALPEQDDWRIPLLNTLLTQRYEMSACGENLEIVSGLIESLCSSWSPPSSSSVSWAHPLSQQYLYSRRRCSFFIITYCELHDCMFWINIYLFKLMFCIKIIFSSVIYIFTLVYQW